MIAELDKIKIDSSGSVLQLRQRLVSYVSANPSRFASKPEAEEGYNEDVDRTRDIEETFSDHAELRSSSPHNSALAETPPTTAPAAQVLDQMRKWNCHFDGRDLYAFLERIYELQRAYQFTDGQLL